MRFLAESQWHGPVFFTEANISYHLRQYLAYLKEFRNPEIEPETFFEHFAEYLPSTPPEGWDISLSREWIEGDPQRRGEFTLRMTTPSRGKALLTVKAILDKERFVVSEVLGIEGLA